MTTVFTLEALLAAIHAAMQFKTNFRRTSCCSSGRFEGMNMLVEGKATKGGGGRTYQPRQKLRHVPVQGHSLDV
eukprot:3863706-Amphidinium_carterae.2